MNPTRMNKVKKVISHPVTAETPANNDHFQASTKTESSSIEAKTI